MMYAKPRVIFQEVKSIQCYVLRCTDLVIATESLEKAADIKVEANAKISCLGSCVLCFNITVRRRVFSHRSSPPLPILSPIP